MPFNHRIMRPLKTSKVRLGLLAFTLAGLLSGCGFQLKGSEPLGASNIASENAESGRQSLKLFVIAEPHLAEFKRQLTKAMLQNNLSVVDVTESNLQLSLLAEDLNSKVLARDSAGRPDEYQWRLSVSVKLMHPCSDKINDPTQWNESEKVFQVVSQQLHEKQQLLASYQQQQQQVAQMRQQLADKVLRWSLAHSNTGSDCGN